MALEVVDQALLKLREVALRQENTAFDKHYFVDGEILAGLLSPDWQIIFGRRGAGKTTILTAFADQKNSSDDLDIAILVDLRTCAPSDLGASAEIGSVRYTAASYYFSFVKRVCALIYENYTSKKHESLWNRLLKHTRMSPQSRIDDLVLKIKEVADHGLHRAVPTSLEIVSRKSAERKSASTASLSASITEPSVGVSETVDALEADGFDEKTSFIYSEVSRYQEIRHLLEDFFDAVELSRVYILIDEWTFLDKSGVTEIQPLFAELLSRTFSGIPQVTFKISAIRGSSTFYMSDTAAKIGLQVGEDIFVGVDLDRFRANERDNNEFFERLLYKKLVQCHEGVLKFSKVGRNGLPLYEPQENFIRNFFKNQDTFNEVVDGSGKVPRKFIELFCDVSREFDFSVKKKWDRPTAMSVLTRNAVVNKGNFSRSDSPMARAFARAREVARTEKSRVFLVRRKERQEIGLAISDLFHHELIHLVDDSALPVSLVDDYDAYYLDYGYFLSEVARIKDFESVKLKCPLVEGMTKDDLEALTVGAEHIGGEVITCSKCSERVSKHHPLVAVHSICPSCYKHFT